MEVARIIITRVMAEDGELLITATSDPEDLDLVEALGMMRLAEDALLHPEHRA